MTKRLLVSLQSWVEGSRMFHFPLQLKPLLTSRSVSTGRGRNVLLSQVLIKVLSPGM